MVNGPGWLASQGTFGHKFVWTAAWTFVLCANAFRYELDSFDSFKKNFQSKNLYKVFFEVIYL